MSHFEAFGNGREHRLGYDPSPESRSTRVRAKRSWTVVSRFDCEIPNPPTIVRGTWPLGPSSIRSRHESIGTIGPRCRGPDGLHNSEEEESRPSWRKSLETEYGPSDEFLARSGLRISLRFNWGEDNAVGEDFNGKSSGSSGTVTFLQVDPSNCSGDWADNFVGISNELSSVDSSLLYKLFLAVNYISVYKL